jgi:Lipopolysaccharide-assembly, LptC-related
MRLSPKLLTIVGCLALALPATAGEKGEDEAPGKGKPAADGGKADKPAKGEGEKKGKDEKEPERLSFPIPEGHDSKGLRFPLMDADGKKTMSFIIGLAKRTDPDHVEMAQLQIQTFDSAEKPEMLIEMPASLLNLNTRVITTDSHVTVKRADFEISGKSMVFNTETKEGKLSGNVRMLIYNLADEPKEDAPAPTKDETKPSE